MTDEVLQTKEKRRKKAGGNMKVDPDPERRESIREQKKNLLPAVCCLLSAFTLVFLMSGCAQKWAVMSETPGQSLQWPFSPEPPRVEFSATMSGFKEAGPSFSGTLRNLVVGASEGGKFVKPVSFAKGRDGRYAIADTGAKVVHLYIPGEQRYLEVRKVDNKELSTPVSVVFDDDLRLYVSDSALGRVSVYDKDGEFLFAISKTNMGPLQRPTGLAYNSAKRLVYVVDTAANRVIAFRTDGTEAFSFGERGVENGQFNFPTYIFYLQGGDLFVSDTLNFRVQIFSASGKFVSLFGHHGDGTGDFALPKGIAADKNGTIYVADALFNNIQLFNQEGKFLLTVGGRGTGQGQFLMPSGLFIEGDTLYVCDSFNGRVQIFKINGL